MQIGDLVTRYSHQHDVIFRIVEIKDGKCLLKGEVVRLICDADEKDLRPYKLENKIKVTLPALERNRAQNLVEGKILHLDGDEYYLKKAMKAYQTYDLKAIGYHVEESHMSTVVASLINKHHPDVLVLTGHDSLKTNNKNELYNLTSYRNSSNFVNAVLEARKVVSDKDSLVIVAGACQSYYEALIDVGANFASSPARKNIHLLDPVIVASQIASIRVTEYADINDILQSTISKEMGGLETRGRARRTFLGGNANAYG